MAANIPKSKAVCLTVLWFLVSIAFLLSGGNAHDSPKGRDLLEKIGHTKEVVPLLMDRAYEGDKTRALATSLGYIPVVPPKKNRIDP